MARWPLSTHALDKLSMALALALPWIVALSPGDGRGAGTLALVSGVVQVMRLSRWRGGWTWNQPILWSLHLGMALLGFGLVLWGLAQFGTGSEVAAVHVLVSLASMVSAKFVTALTFKKFRFLWFVSLLVCAAILGLSAAVYDDM